MGGGSSTGGRGSKGKKLNGLGGPKYTDLHSYVARLLYR